MAAQRGQVAFAGAAALVIRNRVVEVALRRGTPATRGAARGGAGFDQMPEAPTGLVTRLLMAMVAAAPGQRVNGHRERAGPSVGWPWLARAGALHGGGELVEAGELAWSGWATWRTAVAEGPAVVIGDGEARTGRRVVRGQRGQLPGERWIQWPEAGEVARFIGQAEQRGQGDGQVEPRREPPLTGRRPPGRCTRGWSGVAGGGVLAGIEVLAGTGATSPDQNRSPGRDWSPGLERNPG